MLTALKILFTLKNKAMQYFVFILVLGFLFFLFWLFTTTRDRKRVKRENVKKEDIVLARVKEKRDSIWICKFFKLGNHYGFFRYEPRDERVDAVIVGYDKENDLYELRELD